MRTLQFIIMMLGCVPATLAQTWADTVKTAEAYGNLRDTLTDQLLQDHAGNLMLVKGVTGKKLGLQGARTMTYAISTDEAKGLFVQNADQYGLLQERQIMVDDYFLHNRGIPKFTARDLLDPRNVDKTLDVLNWYIKNYKLDTPEKIIRAWNGGPTGYRDDLVYKDSKKMAVHRQKLVNTKAYYRRVMTYWSIALHFEQTGIAPVLTDGPPRSASSSPGGLRIPSFRP